MVDNSWKRLALGVALALLGGSAIAAHRCVDAKGKVTYQDAACRDAESTTKVEPSEGLSTRTSPGAKQRMAVEQAPQTPTSVSSGRYINFCVLG